MHSKTRYSVAKNYCTDSDSVVVAYGDFGVINHSKQTVNAKQAEV